jgi:VWFA-related protein
VRLPLPVIPAALLLTLAIPTLATDPAPTPAPVGGLSFKQEVDVTVVNVDVFVRDKDDKPVPGLTKDDFRLFQSDVERPISHFAVMNEKIFQSQVSSQQVAIPDLVPQPEVPEELRAQVKPTYMMIYIDNENLRPLDRNRVLRDVRTFVTDTLMGPVQMMVVSYQRSFKVLQPFTTDSKAVNDALRSLGKDTGGRSERDSSRRDIVNRIRREEDNLRSRSSGGSTGYTRESILQDVMSFADEEANNLSFTVNALRGAISMIAGLDGRKVVIYVSDGLPLVPGLGLFYEYSNIVQDTSILSLRSRYDRSRLFDSLVSAANGQNVSFYTVDAAGLRAGGGMSAEDRYAADATASAMETNNYQDSIRMMADATGGLSITNTNNISEGLDRVREDLFTYYSLGYTVAATGADKVHFIKVELADKPELKGLSLRYRRRFVEKSLETQVQDRVMTSLMVDVTDNPMKVEVTTGEPVPAMEDRSTVPVHVSIPLQSIALIPETDDYVGRVVLFVAARDEGGKQSDLQRQEHEIRVPAKDYDLARSKNYGFDLQLLMEKGSYRVTVAIMDQVTRQASYSSTQLTVQ